MRLSATNIADYLSCPQKFYYRLKSKQEDTPALIYGRNFHTVLENYRKTWGSLEEAYDLYSYMFDDKNKFSKDLKVFLVNFSNLVDTNSMSESTFDLPTKYDDVFLVGKIDCINSSGYVIDWKTGFVKKDLSANVQGIIYSHAYKEWFGKKPNKVMFCSMKTGEIIEYRDDPVFSNYLLNDVIDDIVKNYSGQSLLRSGIYNNICSSCLFKNICYKELGKTSFLDY